MGLFKTVTSMLAGLFKPKTVTGSGMSKPAAKAVERHSRKPTHKRSSNRSIGRGVVLPDGWHSPADMTLKAKLGHNINKILGIED